MCPACYATLATVLAGTATTSGLAAAIAAVVYRKKHPNRSEENPK